MARYSRVRGPAIAVALNSTLSEIPGFNVSRQFGRGSLHISGHVYIFNNDIFSHRAGIQIELDGVALNGSLLEVFLRVADRRGLPFVFFEPVDVGVHVISLLASAASVGVTQVIAGGAELSIIELPEWDSDDDLVTL